MRLNRQYYVVYCVLYDVVMRCITRKDRVTSKQESCFSRVELHWIRVLPKSVLGSYEHRCTTFNNYAKLVISGPRRK